MSVNNGKNGHADFRRDLSRYIDRASKSQERFIALKETRGNVSTEKKNEILVKEKTPLGHFFSKISALFSSSRKEEIEEGEDVTDKIKENEDRIVETYSDDNEIERVVEESPKKKSGSWFSRLFSVETEEEVEEQLEEEIPVVPPEDMKQLALFANEFLHKLSPDDIMALKREGKIDDFKSLLRKNNLIK